MGSQHEKHVPTRPKVSVLMACHNARQFIEAAISSVLGQTHQNWELIIVDDGSTDRSSEVVAAFRSDKIHLEIQSNRGAANARNVALRRATGDFVIFMDSDDVIAPTHLEALLGRLADKPDCVALSQWARFYHAPSEAHFPRRPTEQDMPGPDWLELDWALGRPMTQSGMILLPRSLLERHGGWDERLTLIDDFEFFSRLISNSQGVLFAEGARLYYRSGLKNNLSSRKSRKAIESAFLSLTLGTSHLLAVKNTAVTRRVCANMLKSFDYTYYPAHSDLRAQIGRRVTELGGADIEPDGPPRFHQLRRVVGWRGARLIQGLVSR
jgi:glycosyltransferase involved in cell wall biosynthesis